MDPKGGTVFLLLVCYTVLAASVIIKGKSKTQATKEVPRQLVRKCMQTEKEQPDIDQLATALGSDVSAVKRDSHSPSTAFLSMFANVMKSVLYEPPTSKLVSSLEKMESQPLDDSELPNLIQTIQSKVSGPTKCSAIAVIAERAWDAATNEKTVENMDSEKYEWLLSAAEKIKENLPKLLKFPKNLSVQKMRKLMKMLRKFTSLVEKQGAQVFKWVKEYINEKYLKCSSTSDKCDRWNKTATTFAIDELGPFLTKMSARDVELFSEDGLCDFLKSDRFEEIMGKRRLSPSLSKKFLSKFERCPEFLRNLDKLGKLGCYFDSTKLTEEQRKNLSETSQCSGRQKKINIQQLSDKEVVALLKNPEVELRRKQKRALVMQYLGEKKCSRLSAEQLKDLERAAEVVPRCILKRMLKNIRCDSEALKEMPKVFAKTSVATILNKQCSQLSPTEAMDTLPDTFLEALSVKRLATLKVKLWKKVTNVMWREGQAIYLFNKMKSKYEKLFKNLGSLILGVTCEEIESTKDKDVWDMSLGLTDAPRSLSKVQAMCVTQKLTASLESQKQNYFEKITAEELGRIPADLLIHLPPETIKNLPASVCSVFLGKMKIANFSTLPEVSPSRSALMNRSVMCLGKDLSRVSAENITKLGLLLCEMPPSHLELLKPKVLAECLRVMASCSFIPEKHRKGVVKLLTNTFGNTSDWDETTMEEVGALTLWDESTELRLPEKQWALDSLRYLAKKMQKQTDAFKKNLFRLVISQQESKSSSTPVRKEREVNENNNGNGNNKPGTGGGVGNSNSSTNVNASSVVPTPELIQQLADEDTNTNTNDQWTPQQLEKMSLITFKKTVDILGEVTSYSPEQLAVLCTKAVEAWGDAQSMNESQVAQLGCIAQCFTDDKLMMMEFSQSSLADIASCGWTYTQVAAVWKGAASYNSLSAEMLDATDMMAMGRFICGLNSTEIQQLNTTAFTDVVASINKVGCSAEVAKHFKAHLVDVFGDPKSWTQVQVSEAGTFVAALDATEFSSLKSSVFSHLSPESIPLFPPSHIAKLTPDQLWALGPDNAAKVTAAQKAGLSASQLSALKRAVEGSREQGSSSQAAQVKGTVINLLVIFVLGLVLL